MLVIFISYPFFNIIISILYFFFFNDTATTEIYTLSLHDALPILHYNRTGGRERPPGCRGARATGAGAGARAHARDPPLELPRDRAVVEAVRRHVQLAPPTGWGDLSRALPPGDQRPRPGRENEGRARCAARAGRSLRLAEPHPVRLRGGAAPLPGSARRDRAGSEARVRRLRCGSSRSKPSGTRSPSVWRSRPSSAASARWGGAKPRSPTRWGWSCASNKPRCT